MVKKQSRELAHFTGVNLGLLNQYGIAHRRHRKHHHRDRRQSAAAHRNRDRKRHPQDPHDQAQYQSVEPHDEDHRHGQGHRPHRPGRLRFDRIRRAQGGQAVDRPGRIGLDQRQGHGRRLGRRERRRQRQSQVRRRQRGHGVGIDRRLGRRGPGPAQGARSERQRGRFGRSDRLGQQCAERDDHRSGDVNYYGDPKISRSVVGSGGTRRLGGAPR
ncbi:hypothetical protein LP419_04450 [Massilia sp. H-1]|nr:hypothetical protein LP419_04450 [Massilia sp. H-1]